MEGYQKVYKVVLHTRGPVFIGNGNKIHKKEYVFLDRRKYIGILDYARFYSYIRKRHYEKEFERFLVKESRKDLFSWLREYDIPLREIEPYLKYKIPVGDTGAMTGGRGWELLEFVKDPYGMPYIPGSSIKGALRTIILAKRIKDGGLRKQTVRALDDAASRGGGRNNYLKREDKQIAVDLLYTIDRENVKEDNAVRDELSGFIVSDSEPLTIEDMVLCQKLEVHTDGEEKGLNLLRECIKPGVDISFTITIDTSKCRITADELKTALRVFSEIYEECFLDAFDTDFVMDEDALFLGGGSGFVDKTLIYSIFGREKGIRMVQRIFDKTRVPRYHNHYKDDRMGASPHILKCTVIDGKRYQMGLCGMSIL